jgi:hypothetical protein
VDGQAGKQAGRQASGVKQAGRWASGRLEGSQGSGLAGWHEGRKKGRKGWKRDNEIPNKLICPPFYVFVYLVSV